MPIGDLWMWSILIGGNVGAATWSGNAVAFLNYGIAAVLFTQFLWSLLNRRD